MTVHILLIEDDHGIAKILELELGEAKYQISIAHDGMSGLQMAKINSPGLILLDWELPFLTGLEICLKLRSSGSTIPIIFMTAKCGPEYQRRALEAGANDYIMKPFYMQELLTKLAIHLHEHQSQNLQMLSC